jgi:hypothetical protein
MDIKLSGKECENVLKDFAFANFGKLLGCDKPEDMNVDIDCSYSAISKMEITKKDALKSTEE